MSTISACSDGTIAGGIENTGGSSEVCTGVAAKANSGLVVSAGKAGELAVEDTLVVGVGGHTSDTGRAGIGITAGDTVSGTGHALGVKKEESIAAASAGKDI